MVAMKPPFRLFEVYSLAVFLSKRRGQEHLEGGRWEETMGSLAAREMITPPPSAAALRRPKYALKHKSQQPKNLEGDKIL